MYSSSSVAISVGSQQRRSSILNNSFSCFFNYEPQITVTVMCSKLFGLLSIYGIPCTNDQICMPGKPYIF